MVWPFNGGKGEQKALARGGAVFVGIGERAIRSTAPKDYITEGYQFNVVVYRAVREIVQAATSINIELYSGENLVESHPVLDLINNPNPTQSWDQFIGEMLVNRMLMGEKWCVGLGPKQFTELWAENPLDMSVEPGPYRIPSGYIYKEGDHRNESRYECNPVTGESDVFFLKLYNPLNPWRGQSPLMAAALAGDTFNAGSRWNYSLLGNSARPSGLIRFKEGYPGGDEIQKIRQWFKRDMQGSGNAGGIPMLPNDAEWVQLSQTPRDMDFLNSMKEAAMMVASAMGVPIPLINNDASTFNNLEQAKERLYTDTVIPIMEEFITSFGNWLLPRYGEGLTFKLDLDSIPALEGLRERKFRRTVDAWKEGLITREEGREALGYEPDPEGEFRQLTVIGQQPQENNQDDEDDSKAKSAALLQRLAYG